MWRWTGQTCFPPFLRSSDNSLNSPIFWNFFQSQVDYGATVCAYVYAFFILLLCSNNFCDLSIRYLYRSSRSINISECSVNTSHNTHLCLLLYLCSVIWITVMGDQSDDRTIKPLYLKDSDIQCSDEGRITDFDLLDCVIKFVGNSLHCLQLDIEIYGESISKMHIAAGNCFRKELCFAMSHFTFWYKPLLIWKP